MTPRLITDLASFTAIHQEQQQRIGQYLSMAKSNYQRLDAHVQQQMGTKQEQYLHAINHGSRITFAEIALRHVTAWVEEAEGERDLRMVTLIPTTAAPVSKATPKTPKFAMSVLDAPDFDVRVLHKWASKQLDGQDFVGVAEAALFPVRHPGPSIIAYHVHAIPLGRPQAARISRDLAHVRAGYRTMAPGIDAAHVQSFPSEKLETKLLYMQKFPMRSYHPGLNKKTGRWAISKPLLRTGELVQMCRVLANQQLDGMLFGGGSGEAVVDAIRAEALRPYQAELDLRAAVDARRFSSRR